MSIISGLLKRTNRDVQRHGYARAMKNVMAQTHSQLKIFGLTPSLKKILKTKPVLLISNHPGQAEVLAIFAALPQRSDYYLVASNNFMSLLPAIDRHIIPVFIGHYQLQGSDSNWKLKFLKKFHPTIDFDHSTAHQKNIDSINLASQKLSQGALVQIFPILDDKIKNFAPGVGHLLKNAKKLSQANVVMIHVTGSSDFDYLRLIPFVGRLLPPFGLNFSPPFSATNFIGSSGRDTAKNLEVHYNSWVNSIENRVLKPTPVFRFSQRSYLLFRSFLLWFFTSH